MAELTIKTDGSFSSKELVDYILEKARNDDAEASILKQQGKSSEHLRGMKGVRYSCTSGNILESLDLVRKEYEDSPTSATIANSIKHMSGADFTRLCMTALKESSVENPYDFYDKYMPDGKDGIRFIEKNGVKTDNISPKSLQQAYADATRNNQLSVAMKAADGQTYELSALPSISLDANYIDDAKNRVVIPQKMKDLVEANFETLLTKCVLNIPVMDKNKQPRYDYCAYTGALAHQKDAQAAQR